MSELPFIDEHSTPTSATAERVWEALTHFLRSELAGGLTPLFARAVGCEAVTSTPDFAGEVGQTIPGFRVTRAERGRLLELEGQHRFARYRLTFGIDPDGRLHAASRGAFPGASGLAYRTLVIRSGGHRVITQGMLRRIAHLARR